jgi:nitrate reductase gamma subunit
MSPLLHFVEHPLQEFALAFMGTVYILRILWLLRFPAGRDRQARTGSVATSPRKGILYSWANIAMPWEMESTRKQPILYAQFVIFHLGVVSAIGLSFIIPYSPQLLQSKSLVLILQISTGSACLVGILRLLRRWSQPVMRAISSPDDYFSLTLLTVWFFFAMLAAPNPRQDGETILTVYFIMTAFFLIYVPFSKISHYLYYPFTRYYFGKTMGHRGVFPLAKSRMPEANRG